MSPSRTGRERCTVVGRESAERPHDIHHVLDAALEARPHFIIAVRDLLALAGMQAYGLREIQLIPVAVRTQDRGITRGGTIVEGVKAGQIVAWLKAEYSLGHGHAMRL